MRLFEDVIPVRQLEVILHFLRVGEVAVPQLHIKPIHVMRRSHVAIGASPCWDVFHNPRLLKIGIIRFQDALHSPRPAEQLDKIVRCRIGTFLNHLPELGAIVIRVRFPSLSDFVEISEHHEVFDERGGHPRPVFVDGDQLSLPGDVIDDEARQVG